MEHFCKQNNLQNIKYAKDENNENTYYCQMLCILTRKHVLPTPFAGQFFLKLAQFFYVLLHVFACFSAAFVSFLFLFQSVTEKYQKN